MSALPLDGRVVIVTGGGGLLGREYGVALRDAGAHVVLTDLAGVVDSAATDTPAATAGSLTRLAADITREEDVAALVDAVLDRFGRVDGLVNNAAINPAFDRERARPHQHRFEDFPVDMWRAALDVNVTGMFLCARAVAPAMVSQRSGVIINVSSTYGVVGPDQRLYTSDDPEVPREFKPVTYSVTKSAALGLTRYLAAYFAGTGVRVNTLIPGGVFNGHSDEFVRRYSARTPLGRMAERHEYNGALVFLLSDASSYMTGANLVVDGGWTAW